MTSMCVSVSSAFQSMMALDSFLDQMILHPHPKAITQKIRTWFNKPLLLVQKNHGGWICIPQQHNHTSFGPLSANPSTAHQSSSNNKKKFTIYNYMWFILLYLFKSSTSLSISVQTIRLDSSMAKLTRRSERAKPRLRALHGPATEATPSTKWSTHLCALLLAGCLSRNYVRNTMSQRCPTQKWKEPFKKTN